MQLHLEGISLSIYIIFLYIFSLCHCLVASKRMMFACRLRSDNFDKLGFASLTVWNMKAWKAMVCLVLQKHGINASI